MNSFIMQIVSKYFYSERDFVNLFCVNKKFKHIGNMYHYNPIALKKQTVFKIKRPAFKPAMPFGIQAPMGGRG